MRICFPTRWVSCTVSSQHSVFKMFRVWIALQPPSVFHSLGVLRAKEPVWYSLAPAYTRSKGFFAAEGGCLPHGHHGIQPQWAAQWRAELWVLEPQVQHPWYRCRNCHGEKTFQKDCLQPQEARCEGGIIQVFQTEICCRSLRHLPAATTAASLTIWISVISSPFQLLHIFFVLDPMLRSITWKSSVQIWPAASQLHEQCWCKMLARKCSLLMFHWKWLVSGGRVRWLQLAEFQFGL